MYLIAIRWHVFDIALRFDELIQNRMSSQREDHGIGLNSVNDTIESGKLEQRHDLLSLQGCSIFVDTG